MLPKIYRLSAAKEFQDIFKKGLKAWGQFVIIRYKVDRNSKNSRFGFIVSTKISRLATQRNRIKRLLRENIRTQFIDKFSSPIIAVIIAKNDIVDKDFWQINFDLKSVFKRIKVI